MTDKPVIEKNIPLPNSFGCGKWGYLKERKVGDSIITSNKKTLSSNKKFFKLSF